MREENLALLHRYGRHILKQRLVDGEGLVMADVGIKETSHLTLTVYTIEDGTACCRICVRYIKIAKNEKSWQNRIPC